MPPPPGACRQHPRPRQSDAEHGDRSSGPWFIVLQHAGPAASRSRRPRRLTAGWLNSGRDVQHYLANCQTATRAEPAIPARSAVMHAVGGSTISRLLPSACTTGCGNDSNASRKRPFVRMGWPEWTRLTNPWQKSLCWKISVPSISHRASMPARECLRCSVRSSASAEARVHPE